MTETQPVAFTEDRIPAAGIAEAIAELAELYGGEVTGEQHDARTIVLPLRRGVATAGAVECRLSWVAEGEGESAVTITCGRELDAPKFQRVAMLIAGVTGSLLFMTWPFFFARARELGTLAAIGGVVAIAVYVLTLRKTSGGIAYDFLQRLAARQRSSVGG